MCPAWCESAPARYEAAVMNVGRLVTRDTGTVLNGILTGLVKHAEGISEEEKEKEK